MADNFGYSFAPTFDNQQQAKSQGGTTAQQPIQVLNFRLPQVTGAATAQAISPLVGEPGRPSFGSAVLDSVLRTVLGPQAAQAAINAMPNGPTTPGSDAGSSVLSGIKSGALGLPPSGAPAPVITPGQTTGPGSGSTFDPSTALGGSGGGPSFTGTATPSHALNRSGVPSFG